jgi:hypothetical protein
VDRDRIATATAVLGVVLGVGYMAAGIAGWILDATDGDNRNLAFWLALLVGGGAAILLGVFRTRSPALSIALTAIGAFAGALALFWSILVPILAAALIVLVVLRSRRGGPATA